MLKISWDPSYVLPLPLTHRFPMSKYEVLPQQLLYEGTIATSNIFSPGLVDPSWILQTHDPLYWSKLESLSLTAAEIRRTGFPLTKELIHREKQIVQGTIECALFAIQYGIAMNIAGGTHHAFTYKGEGFCLLNDMAIAANFLLSKNLATKILLLDLDVHQGNGSAQIFQQEPRVFTFSMHGANNYPLQKEISDLDIALPDGTEDKLYLTTLKVHLDLLMEKVRPDFVFYQAGVDVLATDKLGKLSLSREGCKQRDKLVLEFFKGLKIPITISMGGGYSLNFKDIIEAHANTFRLAQELYF